MVNSKKFYKRQIILDEVKEEGQKKLSDAKVLVIGAGGLGSPLLTYLAAAGVGHITICDDDIIDETNLHRQILFTPEDIGKNKAQIAKERITKQNPLINISIDTNSFDENTCIDRFDIIIDCTDNFNAKFLAHDQCFQKNKIFCVASIHKFEGQVQIFNFNSDVYSEFSPCMRCLWKEKPSSDCVETCAVAGVIGAVAGVVGTIQAMEIIKCILGMNHLKNNQNLLISLVDFSSMKITFSKEKECPLCGDEKKNIFNTGSIFETTLVNALDQNFHIFDITRDIDIYQELDKIKDNKDIAIICKRGISSLKLVKELRKIGYSNSFSIEGGLTPSNKKLLGI